MTTDSRAASSDVVSTSRPPVPVDGVGSAHGNGTVDEPGAPVEPPLDLAIEFTEVRRRAVRAIAHTIRTPLSLVAAPLELLDAATDLGDRERRHVAIARDNVGRVRDEVERLAEVARWPSHLHPAPTDVATLVRTVVPPLQSRLHDRVLRVDLPVTGESSVDGETIGWALQVLVEDVAAGTEPGARIDIATRSHGDDAVVIVVRAPDETAEAHDHVDTAGPLVAAACDVVSTQGGTVAIIATGVELRLATSTPATVVDRTSGNGSPPASQDGPAVVPEPPRPPGRDSGPDRGDATTGDRPVVLLVEDDDQLRTLLEAVLASDYRVESVATAEEALARVQRVPPDLVVCDVVLPGASGEELVEALGHQHELADVPVVMLTGRTDEDLRVRLLQHGADDYLTKPFAVAELCARIANLADRRRDTTVLRDRLEDTRRLSNQLQKALDSRVVIEQAKAFVAADRGIGVEEAFGVIRGWARANETRLHDVARAIVDTDFRP